MKTLYSRLMVVGLIAALIAAYVPFVASTTQAASVNWQVKAASVYPVNSTDFSSDNMKQSLRDLKATGANFVTLIYAIYQDGNGGSVLHSGTYTPTDASLIDAINYAHSIGLKVILGPHLEVIGGSWRAYADATNRTQWFQNYGSMLNHLGDIGKQNGVEGMIIGTELISMSTYTSNPDNTQQWVKMIQTLRSHFGGFLTYSANWGNTDFSTEVPHIGFWSSLDYVGISAYYPLSGSSVNDYINSWNSWMSTKIKPLYTQYKKPIMFTEIGYRSIDGADAAPFDGGRTANLNMTEQANLYEALMRYWGTQTQIPFVGVSLWNWNTNPNWGGTSDPYYTPQHKPAQDIMTAYFGGATTPPPPPSTSGWSATASTQAGTVNNQQSISLKVMNSGSASDMIVDAEIYNSSGSQVYQQFFEHQNIASGQDGNYTVTWTPTVTGTYTLKVGVFSSGWGSNPYWNGGVLTFQVNDGGTPPPPPPPPTTGPITSLTLYNASTDKVIRTLNTTDTINTATTSISIVANTSGKIGSIGFYLDGKRIHIENGAPYAINGNTGTDFIAWNPSVGNHTLVVSAYSATGTAGTNLGSVTYNLTITKDTSTPPPPPPPPPPTNFDTVISFPSDGASINGLQTLKANVTNKQLSDYTMFWQVDNGQLNQMSDSADGTNKEAWVDFTGWNWKGQGPYTMNFVSKDSGGTVISQKSVNIFVR